MAISLIQRILGKTPRATVRRSKGFTLIELLVVLAILTMLAGLVGPRVLSQLGGAKSKTASVQISDLDKSMELFKLDVGRYPTTEEGLEALMKRPGSVNGWNGRVAHQPHASRSPRGCVVVWWHGRPGNPSLPAQAG